MHLIEVLRGKEGERVSLAFDPDTAHLFDRASGLRL